MAGNPSPDARRLRISNADFGTRFVIVLTLLGFLLTTLLELISTTGLDQPDPVATQLQQHTSQIAAVRSDLARLQIEVQALRSTPDRTSVGAQVASLSVTTEDLRKRQQLLEAAIMDDPARALQVPLLRRDLDNLIAQQVQQVEAQRRDVERLYQLLIALFAALSVAVLGPGLLAAWAARGEARRQEKAAGGNSG